MATYTASHAVHLTTVANQVDTVTLTGTGTQLRVIARSGTNHVYFNAETIYGATPATPTVTGDNTYIIDPSLPLDYPWSGTGVQLKLIAGGIDAISIMLI
jgi:hypothetical protein